jgi:PEP-CTERM motif-containing protein
VYLLVLGFPLLEYQAIESQIESNPTKVQPGNSAKAVLTVVVPADLSCGAPQAWVDRSVLGPPNDFFVRVPELFQNFEYRSGSGEVLDEIRVGTTFGDVAVPEPGTLLLLGSGLAGLAVAGERRERV